MRVIFQFLLQSQIEIHSAYTVHYLRQRRRPKCNPADFALVPGHSFLLYVRAKGGSLYFKPPLGCREQKAGDTHRDFRTQGSAHCVKYSSAKQYDLSVRGNSLRGFWRCCKPHHPVTGWKLSYGACRSKCCSSVLMVRLWKCRLDGGGAAGAGFVGAFGRNTGHVKTVPR